MLEVVFEEQGVEGTEIFELLLKSSEAVYKMLKIGMSIDEQNR
jgi:hypothetical protein